MSRLDWAHITSGEMFEALVTTIVYFKDPGAVVLGRRGRDGGQDVRSADDTIVYQAKYHEAPSAAKAIADAKSEAKKIAKYREPTHDRYQQWKAVTVWRLVTPADFNITDEHRWRDEIKPLFENLDLDAVYWEREAVEAELTQFPNIERAFFGGENRVFLSLAEANDRLKNEDVFLRRDELGGFRGRDDELAILSEFLRSEKTFMLVLGPGGIGKSRFLLEGGYQAAERKGWQVLWANVETMASSSSWFRTIATERSTLLLIDEPRSADVLHVLAEQLSGKQSKWKVVVSLRSPNDEVVGFLRRARMITRTKELQLKRLEVSDAEEMCFELISGGDLAAKPEEWRRSVAKELVDRFGEDARFPVWLTLAVHLVEGRGNLSELSVTSKDLAREYILEVAKEGDGFAQQTLRETLQWVALFGTVKPRRRGDH